MKTPDSLTSTAQYCILVVDDHPGTATTLARALSQLGPNVEVIPATGGEVALELVKDKPVDLLITDMMMLGLNGLELIEKMQSHPCGRPACTILMTAYEVPGLNITAKRLKVDEVIIKPIRPERMCQIVARMLEGLGDEAPPQVLETKSQPKILIADDLPDNVDLLYRYLVNAGYTCISAADGEEALEKTRIEMPDLVLLDMNMPIKDGFETLRDIRSDPATSHIPVIILTAARLEPMDMQMALNMGADDYVTKPFDRRELLARIHTRLRAKEAEDIIRRRNRELNLLPEIGRELSARLDIEDLSNVVLRRTVETLGAFMGHIILFGLPLTFQKTYRFSETSALQSPAELPELNTLLDYVNEKKQGCLISDAHSDKRWPVSTDDSTRSVVVAPMFGRFDLLGLLVLAHEQPGYFSLDHLLLLQAIASQAAIAIENVRLFAEMQRIAEKTGKETKHLVSESAKTPTV